MEIIFNLLSDYIAIVNKFNWDLFIDDKTQTSQPSYGLLMYEALCKKHESFTRSKKLDEASSQLQIRYSSNYLAPAHHGTFLDYVYLQSDFDVYPSKLNKPTTRSTNWHCLYALNQWRMYRQISPSTQEYILSHVSSNGLIFDSRTIFSAQYHYFSLFSLLSITSDPFYSEMGAINSIVSKSLVPSLSLISCDGDPNWIGRGRFQIFGYIACICALYLYRQTLQEGSSLHSLVTSKIFEVCRCTRERFLTDSLPISYDPKNKKTDTLLHEYNNKVDYVFFSIYSLSRIIELCVENITCKARKPNSATDLPASHCSLGGQFKPKQKELAFQPRSIIFLIDHRGLSRVFCYMPGHPSMFVHSSFRASSLEFLDTSGMIGNILMKIVQAMTYLRLSIITPKYYLLASLLPLRFATGKIACSYMLMLD